MSVGVIIASWIYKILSFLGIGDVIAQQIKDRLLSPTFEISEKNPFIHRFGSEGRRLDLEIKNTGTETARDCTVYLWMVGFHSDDNKMFRIRRPLGWLDVDSRQEIDPSDLSKTKTIEPGESGRVYFGGTSSVQYVLIFPKPENKSQYMFNIDREKKESYISSLRNPDYSPASSFEEFDDQEKSRQINYRYLVEADWETSSIEIEPSNGEKTVFRMSFSQDDPGALPEIDFEKQ